MVYDIHPETNSMQYTQLVTLPNSFKSRNTIAFGKVCSEVRAGLLYKCNK